ncbi:MAG: NADH-quinone oxidoreductase subunit J [Verrucomicrobiae bacterium]|nr:NADH-quinone oxidoreductase subunit J [Verrucomicrobiae bacterium]
MGPPALQSVLGDAPVTTPGGFLLVLALMTPVLGALAGFVFGGRAAERLAVLMAPIGLAISLSILAMVLRTDAALVYVVGDWAPPLGVALRADGFSAAMVVMTAVVMTAVLLYARTDFSTPAGIREARRPLSFWVLVLGVWNALLAVFLSNDLFSLYVGLELLTFAGVPLVCLDGRAETLEAALRYLMFALLGSVLYLLGAALVYGTFGTLDLTMLSGRLGRGPLGAVAVALMIAGLFAKAALFPLHLWLPPAHGGAPPAASAILSALVVKASFFLVVRLWLGLSPDLSKVMASQLIAALGAAAILFGGGLALRQARLKMMIAYSTVAQIGYLFLMFPLLAAGAGGVHTAVLTGGLMQAVSHACAKAALFLAAGLLAGALGGDLIAGLRGLGRTLPLTVLAMGIGGMSLIGLPPSGGFRAKWLLLSAAITTGQWWWALVMLAGGLLSVGYVFRILNPALARVEEPLALRAPVSRQREVIVLALALCSLLLGFSAIVPANLAAIGIGKAPEVTVP